MAAFATATTLLMLGIFAWVLRPLWRRRPLPATAAIAVLATGVVVLYRLVGTPAALDPAQRELPRTLEEGIARLEADLKEKPDQVDGLRLLGRAYLQQEQAAKARDAFTRAAKLAPDDPDVLAEAAESHALAARDRRFDDAAVALLRHALQVQPMHQRGRWFLGIALRQRGEHAQAAATWEPLLAKVDTRTAAALRPQIDATRADAGLPPLPAPPAAAAAAIPGDALQVRIALAPALALRMPDASVFVIARVPGGPPMPVAVERHALSELPSTITLDDADSPMPTRKLSALKQVEVLARISRSGNAMRLDGDVESAPVRVALPVKGPVEISLR